MAGIPLEMMNQNFNNRLEQGEKAEKHFYNLFIQNNILAYTSYGQSEVGDIWLPNLKSNIGKGFYLELKTNLSYSCIPSSQTLFEFSCRTIKCGMLLKVMKYF